MTVTNVSAAQSQAASAQNNKPIYNLHKLRADNLVPVAQAIQRLEGVSSEQANVLAEAYITRTFHQAALETTASFTNCRACFALLVVTNVASLANAVVNPIKDPVIASSFVLLGWITLFNANMIFILSRAIKGLKKQYLENSFDPDPTAYEDNETFQKAERRINELIVKAQRRPAPA